VTFTISIYFHVNDDKGRLAAFHGEVNPDSDYLEVWHSVAVPKEEQLVKLNNQWRRVQEVAWHGAARAVVLVSLAPVEPVRTHP
jgi:hypothetical protein